MLKVFLSGLHYKMVAVLFVILSYLGIYPREMKQISLQRPIHI